MATHNTLGGIVSETHKALQNINFDIIAKVQIPIHHSLYKLPDITIENLQYVASHPQALKQTERTRATYYSQLTPIEIADTAIGAKWLIFNKLPSNAAIICSNRAGKLYNLELIQENIEDDTQNNLTEFILIQTR